MGTFISLLDIFCQQMGDICQVGGFCALCERRVGECIFIHTYICIEYKLPTIGEYMSV